MAMVFIIYDVDIPITSIGTPVPASVTFNEILDQLSTCNGFSVVMLHAQEFSNEDGSLNVFQLNQLSILLDRVKLLGCEFRLLQDMRF